MSNVLNEEKRQQVLAPGRLGWPLRRIQQEIGVRREAASAYLKAAGIAVRPSGRWGKHPATAKPANDVSPDSASGNDATASACEPYRDFVELSLSKGRNAKAIYQDLVDDHGFTGRYPNEKFDFPGYTFRPRRSKNRVGKFFISFSPAVADKAVKAIRAEIRSWHLHLRSDKAIEDLSRMFNPIIRGWLRYYGEFYRSALYPSMRQLDRSLAHWAERKYKKLRRAFVQGDALDRAYVKT